MTLYNDDSFYIVLTSNSSQEIHPENKASDFVNILPIIQHFTPNWGVAVQSLYFYPKFKFLPKNIDLKHALIKVYGYIGGKPHTVFGISSDSVIASLEDLAFVLNYNCQRVAPNLKIKVIDKRLTIKQDDDGSDSVLDINKQLAEFLGLPSTNLGISKNTYAYALPLIQPRNVVYENTPKTISILLNEIRSSQSNYTDKKKVLYTIPYTPNGESPIYFEVERKEYHYLQNSSISKLSIKLCNEKNEILELMPAQPTVIKLKFRPNMNSRIITVSSKNCNHVHDSNSNNNFQVIFDHPVILDGIWEIALSSIYFPSKLNILDYTSENNDTLKNWITFDDSNPLSITRKNANNIEGIVKYISIHLKTHYDDKINISINLDDCIVIKSTIDYKMQFTASLGAILGDTPSQFSTNPLESMSHLVSAKQDFIFATGVNKINEFLPHAFILSCDAIKPTFSASTYMQSLKVVPFTPNVSTHYQSHHLDYTPLINTTIYKMYFQLKTLDGKKFVFSDDTEEVLINLSLRKKLSYLYAS